MFTKYLADFLSIALIQPKAGPQSTGTPFPVVSLISLEENDWLSSIFELYSNGNSRSIPRTFFINGSC